MSYALISGEPPRDYEDFLLASFENLKDYKVKGLAIVAIVRDTEDPEENMTVTGYWHLSAAGKATAAANVNMDAVDDMILTNIDRYLGAADEPED